MSTKQKVLLTGGTGFIGKELTNELIKNNYQLTILTRSNLTNNDSITYIQNLDQVDFNQIDIVINLAGSPIAVNWNKKNCDEIYNSRISLTKNLVEKINQANNPPQLFISGSAIGIYGINQIFSCDEKTTTTIDEKLFSQKLCIDWEETAKQTQAKTRLVLLRTGIVLGKDGGVLKKMLLPFFLGIGGKIGDGYQYMSWIAMEDVIGIIMLAIINPDIKDQINLTSPKPVANHEFTKALAMAINRPAILSIPEFMVKLVYGKMGEELMLASQKIIPQKALDHGYQFKFTEIEECFNQIFNSKI